MDIWMILAVSVILSGVCYPCEAHLRNQDECDKSSLLVCAKPLQAYQQSKLRHLAIGNWYYIKELCGIYKQFADCLKTQRTPCREEIRRMDMYNTSAVYTKMCAAVAGISRVKVTALSYAICTTDQSAVVPALQNCYKQIESRLEDRIKYQSTTDRITEGDYGRFTVPFRSCCAATVLRQCSEPTITLFQTIQDLFLRTVVFPLQTEWLIDNKPTGNPRGLLLGFTVPAGNVVLILLACCLIKGCTRRRHAARARCMNRLSTESTEEFAYSVDTTQPPSYDNVITQDETDQPPPYNVAVTDSSVNPASPPDDHTQTNTQNHGGKEGELPPPYSL